MNPRFTKPAWALTALMLLLSLTVSTAFAAPKTRTFEVTVTNLTSEGQPFTPPLLVTHKKRVSLFEAGRPASFELKEIAENGNLSPMLDALADNPKVHDVVVAIAGDPPPLMPGDSVTVEIEASGGATFLSIASMLICTNDGFTGINSVHVPRPGESITLYGTGYDAGTEINTEDFADLVPPCPPLTGVPSDDPGSGMSNPALAENGVVHAHAGIQGIDDLQQAIHGWSEPVMMVTITHLP